MMPAVASPVTTFVSVTGADEGTCATPARPCRTFVYAHDQTSRHGEIFALTPGDYGPVRITKPISITGVEGAGVFGDPPTSSQIEVAAGDSDVIYLTGLTLDGIRGVESGVFSAGVSVSGGGVRIRRCTIRSTAQVGIWAAGGRVLIEDTTVSNGDEMGNRPIAGILLSGVSSLVHRAVSSAATAVAVVVDGGPGATLSETSAAGSRNGISLWVGSLFMTRSVVTGNSQGGVLDDRLRPGDYINISSAGDNLIRGNRTDVVGTITNIGTQ